MGLRDFQRQFLTGALKAGIPCGLFSLIVFYVLYVLWVRFRSLAYEASDIWQYPGSASFVYLQIVILLAIAAISIFALFGLAALAGAASARANRISDEAGAITNGRCVGAVMWAITGIAGVIAFPGFCLFMISGTLSPSNYFDPYGGFKVFQALIIVLVWIHVLVPVLVTLWVLARFSTTGSIIAIRQQSGFSGCPDSLAGTLKNGIGIGGRLWAKTCVTVSALIWPLIVYYLIWAWILSLH